MAEKCGKLKFIELENYKSYKGKKVIGPFSNFTAIIGPNGSGKSNLMDAISFVLGEHARHLRELIHGAVVGKPVSKTASVTAVYEMPNGEIVRFSRVIIGNSSEYRINEDVVRLEQYSEALEKIHIFMKVKNFLVFQGAVENIAMKNARERCQMFEEISKSIEYKDEYDKFRSEMIRLEGEAAQNMTKKRTIHAERKEARHEIDEAEKYRRMNEDLTRQKIEYHMLRLFQNEREMKVLIHDVDAKKERLGAEQKVGNEIEDHLKEKKKEMAKLKRDQTGTEQEIKKCDQKINKKKPEFIKVSQMLKHVSEKHKESKKSYENAKLSRNSQQQEIDALESEYEKIKTLQNNYEELQTKKSLEAGRDLELEDNQLSEYHSLKQKVAESTSHLTSLLDKLNIEFNDQKDLSDALDRKKQEIENSLKRKETEQTEIKKRLQKLIEYIDSSDKAINEQKQLESTIRTEVDSANTRVDEINQELETVLCQLGEAKVERHESSRAIKKQELIENLKRLFPGVYGRLLEMCQPSHRRYQVAITKVLGKYMDAIVCDTEKTAKECIQYMKDQRIEPETFLPLDFLDVSPVDERLREINDPPNVHLILDVITCDPPTVKKALQFACGNALVCETVEHARHVAFNMGERKRTVSLEGTLFQKSGVISGGASDLKARARRWDEKQISSLMGKRDSLQTELKDQLKIKRKEAELRTIQSQVKGLETRLKYTIVDKENTEKKLVSTSEEETQIADQQFEIDEKLARCHTRMQELQISINTEQSKMDTIEDDVFREFCASIGVANIREYEDRELRVAKERDRKRLEFTNQLQKISTQLEYEKSRDLDSAIERWEATVAEERAELERCKKSEKKLSDEMENEESSKSELESQLTTIRTKMEEIEMEITEIKRRYNAKTKETQKMLKEINQIESRIEGKRMDRHNLLQTAKMEDIHLPMKNDDRELMSELDKILAYSNTEESYVSSSMPSSLEGLSQEDIFKVFDIQARLPLDYKILDKQLRHASDERVINNRIDDLQNAIEHLSASIARSHAPNLRANDKLGSVEQRLRNTEAEFEEARRRAKKAKGNFEMVRRTRYTAFMECFNSISDHIDPIYKSLSRNPGAQASLLPTNSEEPYLEDIQYQCVAPGKRFQQMDSLSGGEKTIAALALLFAMHRFNPSPFFVLDEIDAALDNTNIGKVSSFIREYAMTRAQIIVISLKEEFYSRADTLIGIYPTTIDSVQADEEEEGSTPETPAMTTGLYTVENSIFDMFCRMEFRLINVTLLLEQNTDQIRHSDEIFLSSNNSTRFNTTVNQMQIISNMSLFGDAITQADVQIYRGHNYAKSSGGVFSTSLLKETQESSIKLPQINESLTNCRAALAQIKSSKCQLESLLKARSNLDRNDSTGYPECWRNSVFLTDLEIQLREAISSLTIPKKKSLLEHLSQDRGIWSPTLPKDLVFSIYLRGDELVLGVYTLSISAKINSNNRHNFSVCDRTQVFQSIPRLRSALDELSKILNFINYLNYR